MAVLSQPAIRQNLVVKFFCKEIGAGAGGGAAGALDKLYIDQSHEAALRKIFETRVFSEAENGRIIARFWAPGGRPSGAQPAPPVCQNPKTFLQTERRTSTSFRLQNRFSVLTDGGRTVGGFESARNPAESRGILPNSDRGNPRNLHFPEHPWSSKKLQENRSRRGRWRRRRPRYQFT